MWRHVRGNAVAYLALFVALGGTSYAAARNSIGQREIKTGGVGAAEIRTSAVRAAEVATGAVRSSEVRNGSLRAEDFARGQLGAATRGPQGERGQTGARGATGPRGIEGPTGAQGPQGVPGVSEGSVIALDSGTVNPPGTAGTQVMETSFTTKTAGKLFVYARALTSVDCTPANDAVLGLYVDDVAVPGTRRIAPRSGDTDLVVNPTGMTATSFPAGTHTLKMAVTCPVGAPTIGATTQRQFGYVVIGA